MKALVRGFRALPPALQVAVYAVAVVSALALGGGAIAFAASVGWSIIALFSFIGPCFTLAGTGAMLWGSIGLAAAALTCLLGDLLARRPARSAAVLTGPALLALAGASTLGGAPAPVSVQAPVLVPAPATPRTERLAPGRADEAAARTPATPAPSSATVVRADAASVGIAGRLGEVAAADGD